MMRRLCAVVLMLLLLPGLPVRAEEAVRTVTFKRLTVPVDAEEVDLGNNKVGTADYKAFYSFLDALPNVKRVDMYETKIKRPRIEEMAARYPDIEFGWTMVVGGHIVRTDMTAFSTRHGSNSTRHSSKDFEVLKYCRNLRALDIGHNNVKDLSFLYDLPHLRVLILADNKITDITPIASLHELEYLELFVNEVTDISPLAGMTSLVDLNICFNRIQDLSPLEGLTNLRRLWLHHSNSHNVSKPLDAEAVARLEELLPDTVINKTSKNSVSEGWREGSHYETIRRVFKEGGAYEPFDDVKEP